MSTHDRVTFEQEVGEKVRRCIELGNRHLNLEMEEPKIRFNQKGRAAGTAYLTRHEVRFNFDMYKQDPNLFVRTVVPHEIAHLFVYKLYGDSVKPHGKEWQFLMQAVFNLSPDRTHKFVVTSTLKSFSYVCDCNEHQLSIRRHNKALKGVVYQCRRCRTNLKFKT